MPRKKKSAKKSAAEALNSIAAEAASMDDGDRSALLKLSHDCMHTAVQAPLSAVPEVMHMASAVLALRRGEQPFEQAYDLLSARVEEAVRAVETASKDQERPAEPLCLNPEELSMDLAVLRGLAEEGGDDAGVTGSFMAQILDRLLSGELPPPLRASLHYLSELAGDMAAGSVTAPDLGEALSALEVAESVFSRLLDEAGGHAASQGGFGDIAAAPFDADRVESFLQRLEEWECALLSLESGEGGEGGSPSVISFISDLAREHDAVALSPCGDDLRGLIAAAEQLSSGIPRESVGTLLELKDLLESHFASLLDQEHAGETKAIGAKACELAKSLRHLKDKGRKKARGAKDLGGKPPADAAPFLVLQAEAEEIADFLAEAPEYIQMIESALLELERDPGDAEHLHEAFRGFHNLKGSAGFLKLAEIVEVSHAAESLLAEAREGRLPLTGALADLAFHALDALKSLLGGVEAASSGAQWPLPDGLDDLVDRLRRAASGEAAAPPKARAKKAPQGVAKPVDQSPPAPKAVVHVEGEGTSPEGLRSAERPVEEATSQGRKADSLVRVSTNRLDALIDAVGELVIAHSMVMQEREMAETANARLARNLSQLSKITRELQELAMGMRMVSLKNTFQKMARLARDLSAKSGVPLDFVYSGEDTEIDRNLVEEINSPLVHMVRNAVDHGLESPEERKSGGKPERGRVELRGYHEGGNVVIELSDDGRGLDAGAIAEKAVSLGIISREEASRLGDEEIYRLVFHEGLSTAREVTDISGRGVGMDVVKRTIEALRGRVDIASKPGRGTVFTIRLPLTLAIIDGMVVKVAQEEYVVPSISIHSSFRPRREQVSTVTGKGEVISLRGEVIPLFRLHRLFGLEGARQDPWDALALIMGSNGDRCAVMVDDIVGQQQVVIKSLGEMFSRLPGVSGGAIMGSGKVALILDPPGLINLAHGRR